MPFQEGDCGDRSQDGGCWDQPGPHPSPQGSFPTGRGHLAPPSGGWGRGSRRRRGGAGASGRVPEVRRAQEEPRPASLDRAWGQGHPRGAPTSLETWKNRTGNTLCPLKSRPPAPPAHSPGTCLPPDGGRPSQAGRSWPQPTAPSGPAACPPPASRSQRPDDRFPFTEPFISTRLRSPCQP